MWGRARTPRRGHDKNDTLTIQIMKAFEMVFTTRHRNRVTIEMDCNRICACITEFTTKYKYMYDGKNLLLFYVYDADKEDRHKILVSVVGNLHCDDNLKSLDLQSYTME